MSCCANSKFGLKDLRFIWEKYGKPFILLFLEAISWITRTFFSALYESSLIGSKFTTGQLELFMLILRVQITQVIRYPAAHAQKLDQTIQKFEVAVCKMSPHFLQEYEGIYMYTCARITISCRLNRDTKGQNP